MAYKREDFLKKLILSATIRIQHLMNLDYPLIEVVEQILLGFNIHKHRTAANKRFNQPFDIGGEIASYLWHQFFLATNIKQW